MSERTNLGFYSIKLLKNNREEQTQSGTKLGCSICARSQYVLLAFCWFCKSGATSTLASPFTRSKRHILMCRFAPITDYVSATTTLASPFPRSKRHLLLYRHIFVCRLDRNRGHARVVVALKPSVVSTNYICMTVWVGSVEMARPLKFPLPSAKASEISQFEQVGMKHMCKEPDGYPYID